MDEDARVVPELCRDWLLAHNITITFLPTALAEGVMELRWPASTSLRLLLTVAARVDAWLNEQCEKMEPASR